MLKRSGRGHDPEGVASTLFGECTVECPACPHPGKNLPNCWEDALESVRYAYINCILKYFTDRLELETDGYTP